MRQTSPAAMEQQGLRDVERWKDKIEIRLDNRQVAFLFFGSALIACLLFILGVIVGKRLESRGHAVAPEIEDPLSLLDRVAASLPATPTAAARAIGNVAVSRAQAAPVPAAKPAKAVVALEESDDDVPPPPSRAEKKAELASELFAPKPSKVVPPAAKPAPLTPPTAAAKPTALAAEPPLPPTTKATAVPAAAPAAKAAPTEAPRGASPELLPPSGMTGLTPPARPAAALAAPTAPPATTPNAVAPAAGRARFALQVGSFLDRAEAEAFASSFAGERPNVIMSEVPGKGVWYRVRVGEYRAFKEAVEAKLAFERKYNKIALVVGPF